MFVERDQPSCHRCLGGIQTGCRVFADFCRSPQRFSCSRQPIFRFVFFRRKFFSRFFNRLKSCRKFLLHGVRRLTVEQLPPLVQMLITFADSRRLFSIAIRQHMSRRLQCLFQRSDGRTSFQYSR